MLKKLAILAALGLTTHLAVRAALVVSRGQDLRPVRVLNEYDLTLIDAPRRTFQAQGLAFPIRARASLLHKGWDVRLVWGIRVRRQSPAGGPSEIVHTAVYDHQPVDLKVGVRRVVTFDEGFVVDAPGDYLVHVTLTEVRPDTGVPYNHPVVGRTMRVHVPR